MILDILGTLIMHKAFNSERNDGEIKFSDKIPPAKDPRVKDASQKYMSTTLIDYLIENKQFAEQLGTQGFNLILVARPVESQVYPVPVRQR